MSTKKNIGSCGLPEGCESSADAFYMLQNYMLLNEKTPKKPTYTGGESSSHDDKNGSSIDSLPEKLAKSTQKKNFMRARGRKQNQSCTQPF